MPKEDTNAQTTSPILLFDGVCNLCNWSVQFILRNEKEPNIRFAPLQSVAGQKLLREHKLLSVQLETLVLIENDQIYTLSSAALRICHHLKLPWSLCKLFLILPPFLRDPIYRLIARNRYRWFGRKEQCMLPQQEWKHRFLI